MKRLKAFQFSVLIELKSDRTLTWLAYSSTEIIECLRLTEANNYFSCC